MIIKHLGLMPVPKTLCAVAGRGLRVGFGEPTWCCWRSREGCPNVQLILWKSFTVCRGGGGSAGSVGRTATGPRWETCQAQPASNLSLFGLLGAENAVPPHLPPSSRPDLTEHQSRILWGTSGNLWTDLGVYPWLAVGCSSTACLSDGDRHFGSPRAGRRCWMRPYLGISPAAGKCDVGKSCFALASQRSRMSCQASPAN